MLRARLRALRARLVSRGKSSEIMQAAWAPEPTTGQGNPELPDGTRLERSALIPVAELAGALRRPGRLTLQHHWAIWAPAVEGDVPLLLELHLAWAQHVDFFGVGWELQSGVGDLGQRALAVDAFHRSYGLTWRTLIVQGTRDQVREATGLRSEILPQTWLRAMDGRVLYVQEGALDDDAFNTIEQAIREATGVADRERVKGWT